MQEGLSAHKGASFRRQPSAKGDGTFILTLFPGLRSEKVTARSAS